MKIMATISKNEAVSRRSNSYMTKLNAIFIDDVLMQKCTSSYNDYNLINTYIKFNVKHYIILIHSPVFSLYSPCSFHYLVYSFGNTNFNKDT
jgi:hypothetical protein